MAQPLAEKPAEANETKLDTRLGVTEPLEKIAEREAWLYNNPEALAMVKRGLAESAAGQGVKMSFVEFADADIE